MDDASPVQAWHRVLSEEKEEGMLEMVVGEHALWKERGFPFSPRGL